MLKFICVALVVLAVLSNAQDSMEDGEERSVGGGSMPVEKQATRQTESMVKLVEIEAKALLKSRNINYKKFKAVSFRTLQGNKGKTHFVKVDIGDCKTRTILRIFENHGARSSVVLEGIQPQVPKKNVIKYFEANLEDYYTKEE